jgi:hypothetical protein
MGHIGQAQLKACRPMGWQPTQNRGAEDPMTRGRRRRSIPTACQRRGARGGAVERAGEVGNPFWGRGGWELTGGRLSVVARVGRRGTAAMGWTVGRGSWRGGRRAPRGGGEARGSDDGPGWWPEEAVDSELLADEAVDGDCRSSSWRPAIGPVSGTALGRCSMRWRRRGSVAEVGRGTAEEKRGGWRDGSGWLRGSSRWRCKSLKTGHAGATTTALGALDSTAVAPGAAPKRAEIGKWGGRKYLPSTRVDKGAARTWAARSAQ